MFASGVLSYKEISPIVEDLVRIKSYKFRKRFIGRDDVAQEIRLKCWKSLPSFDPERGQSIKTFLNVCTENHLRNLMRDTFATFNPPCKKTCDHYDENGRPTRSAYECEIFTTYYKKYQRKCAIRMPASVDSAFESSGEGMPIDSDHTTKIDLDISIRNNIEKDAPELLEQYEILISGGKIPRDIKIKIRDVVRGVINEDRQI